MIVSQSRSNAELQLPDRDVLLFQRHSVVHGRAQEFQQGIVGTLHPFAPPVIHQAARNVIPPGHEQQTLVYGDGSKPPCCRCTQPVDDQSDEREVHEKNIFRVVPSAAATNQAFAFRRQRDLVVLRPCRGTTYRPGYRFGRQLDK